MRAWGFEGLAGSRLSPAVQELKDVHPAPLRRGVLFGAPGNKKPRLGARPPPLPPTKAAYSLLLSRSAAPYLPPGGRLGGRALWPDASAKPTAGAWGG